MAWSSGNITGRISDVILYLHRAGLLLRLMTFCGYTISVCNHPPRPTQPGHPSVGRCISESGDM